MHKIATKWSVHWKSDPKVKGLGIIWYKEQLKEIGKFNDVVLYSVVPEGTP